MTVRRYGASTKAQLQQPRKVYPIDPAYFRRESLGPMMESIVAVELLMRGAEHFYYRANNYEVDFVITQQGTPQQLLQVTYASSIDEVDRREFRSLVRASEGLGVRDLMVITWDLEDELTYDKHKIKLTPLHTWLLTTQTQGP